MFHKLAHDIYTAALIKLAFKANQNNFTHGTSAVFSKTTKRPDREPDKKSPKKGSDSEYWITPMGIVRGSDHWGTVGTCNWNLAGSPDHPGKKIYGFSPWENFNKKTASKKVLKGYYDMTPEEQETARNSLKDNEVVYLSSKPIGRGYEGSAYPVLTKDLGEAIRKNFNGCYGETPHLQRMIELKGNKIDQQVRDLFNTGEFEKAYELYAADNPRKRMKNRLAERMQVLMNPDNADLFAALAKAQPRRVHENIGGGIRAVEPGLGSLIMEKLKVQDDSKGFTEADFISMNTDLAERIMKAHIGDKPAYGTDFPEKFTTPNGKIGPNMRFAPILRGADGKLYQVKDIRNVFDKMVLPEMFRSHETAFHNAGLDNNNQLKIFDFGTKPIEEA